MSLREDLLQPFSSLNEALTWLDSHIDFESVVPNRRSLPTLERMRELVSVMGDPQLCAPSIHLTGTNGKGSTAAMATNLLSATGVVAGTYTSPNLNSVSERLSIDSTRIDDESFVSILSSLALLETLLSERPTRFELLTAAALRWFSDEAVDAMVVEVGVGGTWDCTNVVDADVAVITNISYDHTEILGPTLEGIARDKSGIVKPGSRVIVGETRPDLVALIEDVSSELGAEDVWVYGRDFFCRENRLGVGGRLVDITTPRASYPDLFVPLNGIHQAANAACALAAVEAFHAAPLGPEIVQSAFSAVKVPGRLEVVGHDPLYVVDGAHNVAGSEALAASIEEGFNVDGPKVAIVGMLRGRDPSAMLAPLVRVGVNRIVACPPLSPRALEPELIAEAGEALGCEVTVVRSFGEAWEVTASWIPDDAMVVVTGSLYLVAEAREILTEGTEGAITR